MRRIAIIMALVLTGCDAADVRVSANHVAIANKKCETNDGPEYYIVFGMSPPGYEQMGGVWQIKCKNGAIFNQPSAQEKK